MIKPLEKSVLVICIALALTACGNSGGGNSNPASGSLDTSFGINGEVTTGIGGSDDGASSAAIQSDGKIVAAGHVYNGTNYDFAVVRYNTDGSLDTSFGSGGKVTTAIGATDEAASAVAIQSDGKIVAAGYVYNGTDNDFAVVRYNTDGTLDLSFGTGGKVMTDFGMGSDLASGVAIQSDGKIVAAGYASNGVNLDFAVVRYDTGGNLDTNFDTDGMVTTAIGGSDDGASAVVIQSDGKIVAAGYANNGTDDDFAVVRYDTNGNLDTTFDTDGKVTTDIGGSDDAYQVAVQSDGKIVAAGSAFVTSRNEFAVARYNSDGTIDTTFDSDGRVTTLVGSSNAAFGVAIQSDGKIVAAGSASNGLDDDFAVVRYNSDGGLDTGFGTGGTVTTAIGGSDDGASSVVIQSDGKIVAAGGSYNGTDIDFAVVRYWP
jgi:uncharacterized delta-60 repeat protein